MVRCVKYRSRSDCIHGSLAATRSCWWVLCMARFHSVLSAVCVQLILTAVSLRRGTD